MAMAFDGDCFDRSRGDVTRVVAAGRSVEHHDGVEHHDDVDHSQSGSIDDHDDHDVPDEHDDRRATDAHHPSAVARHG